MVERLIDPFMRYGLVGAFLIVTVILIISYTVAQSIGQKRMGSAIAIIVGLAIAFIAGKYTGGTKGLADVPMFAGVGILGGGMMRDFAIISTAYGVKFENLKKAGVPGVVSLFLGVAFSFIVGGIFAYILGYKNPVDVATIGAGAVTFIVGPVTGGALGASSDVIALSIAAGVIKSILVIIVTPFVAPYIGLDNPTSAVVYGGMMGTTSGVAGGLASVDPKLVPYGAMTATFYTGLGSLMCPSIGFVIVRALIG